MGTLYEYREDYKYALMMLKIDENSQVVNDDGEIVDIKDYIAGLEGDIHEKIEGTILFTKELESDIDGLKKEENTLAERRHVKENLFDKLRSGVAETLIELGEMKMETSKMALSFRKSETVEIEDDFEVPQMYIKRKVEEKPDKVALKKALKAGEKFKGVRLEEHQNLQVR